MYDTVTRYSSGTCILYENCPALRVHVRQILQDLCIYLETMVINVIELNILLDNTDTRLFS